MMSKASSKVDLAKDRADASRREKARQKKAKEECEQELADLSSEMETAAKARLRFNSELRLKYDLSREMQTAAKAQRTASVHGSLHQLAARSELSLS